ncbi:MAG TPA: NUDIX domain-containing protein [Candidatus Absconditabacterales bacterium]|nr:NUDIX domain-containing protein [Candidatus Absconditabacterales bacterium]
MMTSDERSVRIQKRDAIKAMGISPYVPRYKKIQTILECLENCESRKEAGMLRDINDIILSPQREISTAGRLTLFRSHGKLSFGKLFDETGEIQLMFHKDQCKMLKNRQPYKVNPSDQKFDPNQKELRRHVVKMVILDEDGNIAVSHASSSDNYSLPGGGVDEGDHFYDAVHREAKEEVGVDVKIMYELPKVHEHLKKRDRHQLVYGYLCKTQGPKGEPSFVESEILDGFGVTRMSLDDLEKKLHYQIANPDRIQEWVLLDGIFKRDLIILQSAKELLNKTKLMGNHEGYNTITEISDDIIYEGSTITPYQFLEKFIDVGDFVGIKGELFYTHKGEPTIFVSEYQLLSKAIRPLGDKFHGVGENQETAYRQRYLDMIHNRDTLHRMQFRSHFIRVLREYYWKNGFIEIDCPVLTASASGAAAKPFSTHHHAFDHDFFLRICNETELKKATIGGLEKVFTIATNFRNEGSDPSHLQEFVMLEHQNVYSSYQDDMHFTEHLFDYIFDKLNLQREFEVKDKQGVSKTVNFTTPWPKIDYVEGVNQASGLDITSYGIDDADKLRQDIRAKGLEFEGMDTMGTMTLIDYLYKKVLRPSLIGPVFIYNYPRIIAPLARISDTDPSKCEKRQVVVNGREIINSYGELVDPIAQKSAFDEQAQAEAGGDQEATTGDMEYVRAMEYGMPIQAGFGMGIERVIALITQQDNLRDVVMFPLMKPIE